MMKPHERAILVAVGSKDRSDVLTQEMMKELTLLADTLNFKVIGEFSQKLAHPDPSTYVGKGKLNEIKEMCKQEAIDIVIFDDNLSPSQLRNLEKSLKSKIYDRSLLILDIFLIRSKTAQAQTQVELARFQYLLPRLTGMWTHLERQKGGTGTRGGAGEKEKETDKRFIRDRITLLKKKLVKIEQQSATQRKNRKNSVRVALVGYTNAGKSSLMKYLSKEKTYVKNELFATLDTSVKKVVIDQIPFLLSDTVGFITKLPHDLIESFKSTLAEVREADILLHVIDSSSYFVENHIEVVEQTLKEIGAAHIKTMKVFNKIDLLDEPWASNDLDSPVTHISIKQVRGLVDLKKKLISEVKKLHRRIYPNFLEPDYF